ncbi:MAG: cytochrome C biogenesis protein, partial [Rudanella sp.]|nr:cytochrome C biogenesis protein [Rudanella sp.]
MIHETIGQLGHFFVILSFVTALVATIGYLMSALGKGQRVAAKAIAEPELAYVGDTVSNSNTPRRSKPATNHHKLATGSPEHPKDDWRTLARWAFYVHGAAVIGIIVCLYSIIYNHYFEYQYAWSHSSLALPLQYVVSCFWEGQ